MKVQLDTDTRQVRRDGDGFFRSGAGKRICVHCGHRTVCPLVDQLDSCNQFLPALPFVGDVGFEPSKITNTVRVGKAWPQRLIPGETVALYDTKLKVIFGHAEVQWMDCGPIVMILKTHAFRNHIMLDTPPHKAPVELGAWMSQNYGPRIINEGTTLTAIYLQRLDQPPPAPHFKRVEADGPGEGGAAGHGKARRKRSRNTPADR